MDSWVVSPRFCQKWALLLLLSRLLNVYFLYDCYYRLVMPGVILKTNRFSWGLFLITHNWEFFPKTKCITTFIILKKNLGTLISSMINKKTNSIFYKTKVKIPTNQNSTTFIKSVTSKQQHGNLKIFNGGISSLQKIIRQLILFLGNNTQKDDE